MSGLGAIEKSVDKLVYVCGEVSHRINYEKDDKIEKRNPSVGDLNFSVKEIYPIEAAVPLLSKALHVRIKCEDASFQEKVRALADAAGRAKGTYPVFVDAVFADGAVAEIDLGPNCRTQCTMDFLAEVAKIVPQSDTSFSPNDKLMLSPPEERRFGRS